MLDRIRAHATAMTVLTFACLAMMACVPERERQDPHPGLECQDQERCGDHLVCYERICRVPCDMPWHCAEPLECLDEVCQ